MLKKAKMLGDTMTWINKEVFSIKGIGTPFLVLKCFPSNGQ